MRSIEERNAIIEEHLALAKNLASQRFKTVHPTVQLGELLSAAYYGLLDAADRFDESKVNPKAKRPFEAYARSRIHGEMNDYLRSCNWGTRSDPQYLVSLDRRAYSSAHSNERFDEASSLGDMCASEDRPVADKLNSEELFNKIIRSLPKREKRVFQLRYLYGLTMKEIAQCVDLSESRVSQILSQSTEHLHSVWGDRSQFLWEEASVDN